MKIFDAEKIMTDSIPQSQYMNKKRGEEGERENRAEEGMEEQRKIIIVI